jgi:hypothetical protein
MVGTGAGHRCIFYRFVEDSFASSTGGEMAFVVRADSSNPTDGVFLAVKPTWKDALLTAIDLLGQGLTGITITDESGRVFTTREFAEAFVGDRPVPLDV